MGSYYIKKLSAKRLQQCYNIAPKRVKQYLKAELNHVLKRIRSSDCVLELGCGYGRVMPRIARRAKLVIGIDTSLQSIQLGNEMMKGYQNCFLLRMDAVNLDFPDNTFDVVVCIQNGISAFHVDQRKLIQEALRVTKKGGIVLFSSYSEKFWEQRLHWFELQAKAHLLGQIDWQRTRNGKIVCRDGFAATTVSPKQFEKLTSGIKNITVKINEVDESSVFCEIKT